MPLLNGLLLQDALDLLDELGLAADPITFVVARPSDGGRRTSIRTRCGTICW